MGFTFTSFYTIFERDELALGAVVFGGGGHIF